jgi:hypothetical protein
MSPRVKTKRQEREEAFEAWKRDREWKNAERSAAGTEHTAADVLVSKELEERYRREIDEERKQRSKAVYGPDSRHSYWADFIADALATSQAQRGFGHGHSQVFGPDVTEARKRLKSVRKVERRDVTSGDPGMRTFTGPGYLGERFNAAARAEASLASALGLEPLPEGVRQIDIPRWDTGASAAVQATENTEVSEANMDGGSQAGVVGTIAGHVDLSLQGYEFMDPSADLAISQDLGRAIGAALDANLVSGINSAGQTLGLANVTGILGVTWTDASPTSAEFVGQLWEGYNEVATNGQGTASPAEYLCVVHPRRLAWVYNNVQNAQVLAPAVPGQLVACAGIRTALGAGTEDEAYVLLPRELPVFASDVRVIVDDESLSGTAQIRLTAFRFVASGFGRAPKAIARVSGTGMIAPVFS